MGCQDAGCLGEPGSGSPGRTALATTTNKQSAKHRSKDSRQKSQQQEKCVVRTSADRVGFVTLAFFCFGLLLCVIGAV
jgi:hypothetical protein